MSMLVKNKRFFYLSSDNALSSTSSTFTSEIQLPDNEEYDRVTVVQANIPVSYYLIQDGYNQFTLREATDVVITIPAGNYNANSFSLALIALLNASSPGGYTYNVSYPINYTENNTGKFTYTVNTTNAVSFVFDDTNFLNQQFGFNNGNVVATFTPGSGSSTLVSSNVYSFVNEATIFLHSPLVEAYGPPRFGDILQEFYFGNSISLAVQNYVNPDPFANSKKMTRGFTRNAVFSFTDENGLPIYFNGVNVVITLMMYNSRTVLDDLLEVTKGLSTRVMELIPYIEDIAQSGRDESALLENLVNSLQAQAEVQPEEVPAQEPLPEAEPLPAPEEGAPQNEDNLEEGAPVPEVRNEKIQMFP